MLDQHLQKLGFVQSVSDTCIYVASEREMFMIAVHVDDLVLAAKSDKRIGDVKKALGEPFSGNQSVAEQTKWRRLDWTSSPHPKDPAQI